MARRLSRGRLANINQAGETAAQTAGNAMSASIIQQSRTRDAMALKLHYSTQLMGSLLKWNLFVLKLQQLVKMQSVFGTGQLFLHLET